MADGGLRGPLRASCPSRPQAWRWGALSERAVGEHQTRRLSDIGRGSRRGGDTTPYHWPGRATRPFVRAREILPGMPVEECRPAFAALRRGEWTQILGRGKATSKPGERALPARCQRVGSLYPRCTYDIPAIYLRYISLVSPFYARGDFGSPAAAPPSPGFPRLERGERAGCPGSSLHPPSRFRRLSGPSGISDGDQALRPYELWTLNFLLWIISSGHGVGLHQDEWRGK